MAPEVIAELIQVLAQDGPKQLREIWRGIELGDHERLWQPAHKLKSSSAAMRAAELSRLCARLESMGMQGDLSRAAETLKQAVEAFKLAMEALKSIAL